MSKNKDRIILIIYLLGFVAVAATIALLQPLADIPELASNPPDEHARFLVPWYIYEHGTIPTGFEEEIRIPSYGFSYGLYNVFPYIIQGYVMCFVGLFTDSMLLLLYAARFVNVLSGLALAWVVYFLSKKLFERDGFRWAFCFGITFFPECLFLHTYVNTDSMCLLSTAMMLYALVSAYRDGFSRTNSLWLSGGIILCALSYYNAYGYILSSILLFLAYFLKKQEGRWRYDWRQMLKKGCLIGVIVLFGISWWFIRSYILYDGDFLGLATREKMAAQYADAIVNPLNQPTYQAKGFTVLEMLVDTNFFEGAFLSMVAAFGSLGIFGSIWIYRGYKLLLALGLGACVVLPAVTCVNKKLTGKAANKELAVTSVDKMQTENSASRYHRIFFHLNMIFCIAMPLILLIRYAYTMDFQNQGRYLLPAIIPLMYYIIRGLEKLAELPNVWQSHTFIKKLKRPLTLILVLFAILLPLLSTLSMTYITALPIYLETGVVLQ